MKDYIYTRSVSLLRPAKNKSENTAERIFPLDENLEKDLELDKLCAALSGESGPRRLELDPLFRVSTWDKETIDYRQHVIRDMRSNPALVSCFEEILPFLATLKKQQRGVTDNEVGLYKLTSRLGELESYVHCVEKMQQALYPLRDSLTSAALRKLQDLVNDINADETFKHLREALPDLLANIRGIRSVTIGVNLDLNLLPFAATLLSVNRERFTEKSLNIKNRLFGKTSPGFESLSPLHKVPAKTVEAGGSNKVTLDRDIHGHATNPLMIPLFKDLDKVIKKTITPINKACKAFLAVKTANLGNLYSEILFYLGACRLVSRLEKAGLPVCEPEILPEEERICRIEQGYNINLALSLLESGTGDLKEHVITNHICLDEDPGRLAILTGPNRGGKTTFTQALGLSMILAQWGLPVPGKAARISPARGIYTHFPIEEKIEHGTGRLGDETARFAKIFEQLSPSSLLLLNESLASTSATESFLIARDLVQVLAELGVRTIFATHLHELAAAIEEINDSLKGKDKLFSLVAAICSETEIPEDGSVKRTFKILPGPPQGRSYAREIVYRYGLSYEQLINGLQSRGVLPSSE